MAYRRFRLNSSQEQFSGIYAIIADIVDELQLDAEDKFRFAVCVTEAFTNACDHGNHFNPDKYVDLVFAFNEREFSLEITDQGEGKTGEIDLITEVDTIPPEKTSGRGIAIMKKFADKVQVSERDGGGLQLRLVWQRTPASANKTSAM